MILLMCGRPPVVHTVLFGAAALQLTTLPKKGRLFETKAMVIPMNEIIEITDIGDPALDAYARLTEHQLRNRLEPE